MHCMHKEAKTGKKIPWHQDGTYWPINPKATCSAWIAISDVDKNNGCMQFIPESHKDGMLPHLQEDAVKQEGELKGSLDLKIDEKSFDKIAKYIKDADKSDDAEVILGGKFNKSQGFFIEPTVIIAKKPDYITMREEIFGPVMTIFIYEDSSFEETLNIVDRTSEYALTGAILAKDRYVVEKATKALKNSAGNFYINDKPTGAVVGKQPFGGARGSGTNDKAGSMLNLLRWVSPRLIKETFVTPKNYRYPFLEK